MSVKNYIKERAKLVMISSHGTDYESILALLKSDLKEVFRDYLDVQSVELALNENEVGGISITVYAEGEGLKNVGRLVK